MVTFLDIGLFQYFNVVFSVLLIFAIVFAVLHKTNILGKNATINAIVAIAIALMCLLSETVLDLINYIAPWFVLVFVFVILLVLLYQLLGATEKDILGVLKTEKTIQWAIIGVGIIILLAGFAHVLGGEALALTQVEGTEAGELTLQQRMGAILINPKILGMVFIFLIAIFAILFLTGKQE